MRFHLLALSACTAARVAQAAEWPCDKGIIGALQSIKDQPLVKLFCIKALDRNWSKNAELSKLSRTYGYIQIEKSMSTSLKDTATTYCKCARGLVPCPAGKGITSGKCVCNAGTTDDGHGGCKVIPISCPSGKTPAADNKSCICKQGTIDDGRRGCKLVPITCPSGKTAAADNKSCVCKSGSMSDNSGGCKASPIACTSGKVPSTDNKSCICQQGTMDDGKNGCKITLISCLSGKVPSSDNRSCICQQGTVEDGNNGCKITPLTCSGGKIPPSDNKSCVCDRGTKDSGTGTCEPEVLTCGNFQVSRRPLRKGSLLRLVQALRSRPMKSHAYLFADSLSIVLGTRPGRHTMRMQGTLRGARRRHILYLHPVLRPQRVPKPGD